MQTLSSSHIFNSLLLLLFYRTYIVQSEDPLTAIETIATKAIPELLETDKNGYSASFPTMNRYKVQFIFVAKIP